MTVARTYILDYITLIRNVGMRLGDIYTFDTLIPSFRSSYYSPLKRKVEPRAIRNLRIGASITIILHGNHIHSCIIYHAYMRHVF